MERAPACFSEGSPVASILIELGTDAPLLRAPEVRLHKRMSVPTQDYQYRLLGSRLQHSQRAPNSRHSTGKLSLIFFDIHLRPHIRTHGRFEPYRHYCAATLNPNHGLLTTRWGYCCTVSRHFISYDRLLTRPRDEFVRSTGVLSHATY